MELHFFSGSEISNFGAWNLKFNRSFCGISRIFVESSASEKYFSDSGKWPFHTPPIHTPTKCRPNNGPTSSFPPPPKQGANSHMCTATPLLSRKHQFVHKTFYLQFWWPLTPPPFPKTIKWWISSWNSIKKALKNRISNTQLKLRTNSPKIVNKQKYEQTGVSDLNPFPTQDPIHIVDNMSVFPMEEGRRSTERTIDLGPGRGLYKRVAAYMWTPPFFLGWSSDAVVGHCWRKQLRSCNS